MIPSFLGTGLNTFLNIVDAKVKHLLANNVAPSSSKNNHIRKHHWCLGTLVIVVGSWITHSTTATIEIQAPLTQAKLPTSTLIPPTVRNQTPTPIFEESVREKTTLLKTAPKEVFTIQTHTVRKGESLGFIFKARKFDLAIPDQVSRHEIADSLVALSIGRTLTFKLDQKEQLKQIRYPINSLQELVVDLDGASIKNAEIGDLPYRMAQYSVSSEINSSLYEAALDAGLSINIIMEMVKIFGWDIDFVLDIRNGDHFHVVYEDYMLEGEKLADGHILAAEFTTQGQTYRAIRFADPDGNFSYYTPTGESMLGTFLRSPVEFSRISSRFGKRKHPISKKWKTHKGVDYAASRGIPIRATADGKVIHAGRKGGYGNTIILRHAGRFTTLYAHMKGFTKGLRSGNRVKQGDTIGYVGTTGYSTGPHLHYEFRLDGIHRNPLTFKTPKASAIKAELKNQFLEIASSWEQKLDKLQQNHLLAKAGSNSAKL